MKPKILVVDDQPRNIVAMERVLQEVEVETISATSGDQALYLTIEHEFALAIVDVQMPEMDGYELVEFLQGGYKTKDMPVIFVSAIYSSDEYRLKGYDSGAVAFLPKPFMPELLISKVNVFLALYRQKVQLRELVNQLQKQNQLLKATTDDLELSNDILATRNVIAATLSQSLELDVLLKITLDKVLERLRMDAGSVHLINPDKKTMNMQAHQGLSDEFVESVRHVRKEEGVTGQAMAQGKPVVVYLPDYPVKRLLDFVLQEGFQTFVSTPLISKGQMLGAVILAARQKINFSSRELALLEAIGQQIGVAVENAQLFQAEQRQRHTAEMLHQVTSILNSSLDRNIVLGKIMEQFGRVIQYDGACIFLKEGEELIISQATGFSSLYLGYTVSLTSDVSSVAVFRNKTSMVIADAHHDPRWQVWKKSDPIRSWMGSPLLIDDEPIGVLTVDSFSVGTYAESDVQTVEIFAAQAARAIENARLYGLVQETTQRLEVVASTGERLSTILNPQELLVEIVNSVKDNFDYYHAHIYLLDESKEWLLLFEGTGQAGATMKERGHKIALKAETSLVARAARFGNIVRVDNVRQADDWLPNPLLPDTHSEMAVPIIRDGRVVGVLDVQDNKIDGLNEGDANLLRSLAGHVAVALTNAQLFEQTTQAKEEAEMANASKDKFFSILAHDLRGPFTPLLGNAELLFEMADLFSKKEIKDMSRSIHRSGKRVLALLENLLQWSRMQMGRIEYQPEQVDLCSTTQKTIELLMPTAETKNITLQNNIVAETFVYADEHMLDTVIRNLTNNALKFTPEGGRVTVDSVVGSEFIEISVADTGIGINSNDIDKLFRVDVQYTTIGTAKEKGTGLGLIMCWEMVEMNGGKIWVESELGQGTVVKFTVPGC